MTYYGRDLWIGYHPDPIRLHDALRRRDVRHGSPAVRFDDDPVHALRVTLAKWGDEPVPRRRRRTAEKYRRRRLRGLADIARDLTPDESRELEALVIQVRDDTRRREARRARRQSQTEVNDRKATS